MTKNSLEMEIFNHLMLVEARRVWIWVLAYILTVTCGIKMFAWLHADLVHPSSNPRSIHEYIDHLTFNDLSRAN